MLALYLAASNTAVTNKHTAKLHHVGSLYILTYDARKLKQKKKAFNELPAQLMFCAMDLF